MCKGEGGGGLGKYMYLFETTNWIFLRAHFFFLENSLYGYI